jgi:hypothetical protein
VLACILYFGPDHPWGSSNFILSKWLCHQPINQNQASTSTCLLISTALLAPHSLGHHVRSNTELCIMIALNLVHACDLLTPWSWVLLGNTILRQQSGNFRLFMETGISLPCSQKPANSPILKQIIPIHHLKTYWFDINFNIILTSITIYVRLSIFFRFPHQTPFLPTTCICLSSRLGHPNNTEWSKVCLLLMITVQKTYKNILSSFKHLPW